LKHYYIFVIHFEFRRGILADIKCRLSTILGCRRISQRKLARDSGLSVYTVNKLFNENWAGIGKGTMIKLCKTLNVGIGDLFVYEK